MLGQVRRELIELARPEGAIPVQQLRRFAQWLGAEPHPPRSPIAVDRGQSRTLEDAHVLAHRGE